MSSIARVEITFQSETMKMSFDTISLIKEKINEMFEKEDINGKIACISVRNY